MANIETSYVNMFEDNIRLLVQQKGTKFRNTVEVDTDFTGEHKFYDQLGADTMTERTARNQDTPIDPPNHQRRRISARDFVHARLLDKEDELKMLADPKGKYTLSAVHAASRQMDDVVIEAFNATAYTGKAGGTEVSFDSNNQIAAGGTGLTKAKILSAKLILDDNDVDDEDRYLACAPQQIIDLLNTVEVGSSDYNTVKTLVDGQVDTWLGFKFIKSTRLGVDGSSSRLVYCWHKWAIKLAIQKEATANLDIRPDKNRAWQIMVTMSIAATRLEEKRIAQIACVET
jgi:hypothetical protein